MYRPSPSHQANAPAPTASSSTRTSATTPRRRLRLRWASGSSAWPPALGRVVRGRADRCLDNRWTVCDGRGRDRGVVTRRTDGYRDRDHDRLLQVDRRRRLRNRTEQLQKCGGVRRSLIRVSAGRCEHDVVESVADPDAGRRRTRHVLVHVPVGDRDRLGAGERGRAGEHLEQHDAGGVDVGTLVGDARLHLLRRQVGDGAEQQSGGDVLRRRAVRRSGQSEVGDVHVAVGVDQDVLGLDVPVHHALGVRGGQRLQHRVDDGDGLLDGQAACVG